MGKTSDDALIEAMEAVDRYGTVAAAARAKKIARTTLSSRYRKACQRMANDASFNPAFALEIDQADCQAETQPAPSRRRQKVVYLPPRTLKAYRFIARRIRAGQPPLTREIAAHLGITIGGAAHAVRRLIKSGVVYMEPNHRKGPWRHYRGLRLTPNTVCQ
jgi:hypothetical protein